jgi:hypothetical protein
MKPPFFSTEVSAEATEDLPLDIPISERVRRLPEALLLTAGYYTARVPVVRELFRERI